VAQKSRNCDSGTNRCIHSAMPGFVQAFGQRAGTPFYRTSFSHSHLPFRRVRALIRRVYLRPYLRRQDVAPRKHDQTPDLIRSQIDGLLKIAIHNSFVLFYSREDASERSLEFNFRAWSESAWSKADCRDIIWCFTIFFQMYNQFRCDISRFYRFMHYASIYFH